MGHGYRPLISKIRVHNPNKTGSQKANYNYLHYIATREGVDLTRIQSMDDLISENVDMNPSVEDQVYTHAGNEDYLKYMSFRPKSQGLFGNIDTENFSNVSKRLIAASAHKKIIYRGIISLSALDAKALEYNSVEKWNLYLKSVMPDIASELGLSPNDMTWVAAFHAEDDHPHVHYMLWDNRDIVKSPYIHVRTQEACRKICQDKMFPEEYESLIRQITEDERQQYYGKQNEARKNITDQFKDILYRQDIVPGEYNEKLPGRLSDAEHEELSELYKNILQTLPGSGRINYQFMPMECKAYIDRVSELFLKKPEIRKEYNQYVKAIEEIHKSLGKTVKEINQEKEKSIKELYNRTGNIVLKAVMLMRDDMAYSPVDDFEENYEDDCLIERDTDISSNPPGISENSEYQDPDESADTNFSKEDVSFCKMIGKMTYEKSRDYNPVLAEQKLKDKLAENPDAKMHAYCAKVLGKLYAADRLILHDSQKAIQYLKDYLTYDDSNFDVSSTLARLYASRKNEEYNPKLAEKYYLRAMELNEDKSDFLKLRLSRLYSDKTSDLYDIDKAIEILDGASDNKGSVSLQLGNIYNNPDNTCYDHERAMDNYLEASNKNNYYAMYNLGKIYVEDMETVEDGLELLETAASANISQAHLQAAKIYMRPEYVFYDLNQAELHLEEVEAQLKKITEKPYAALSKDDQEMLDAVRFYYGKMYVSKNEMNQAVQYYTQCIDGKRDNLYTQNARINLCKIYLDFSSNSSNNYDVEKAVNLFENASDESGRLAYELAKSYSNEDAPHHDEEKSISYFLKSVEQGNAYAAYYLGKIMTDSENLHYDVTKGAEWLQKAADQNVLPAITRLAKVYMDTECKLCNPTEAVQFLEQKLQDVMTHPADEFMQSDIYTALGKVYANRQFPVTYSSDKAIRNLQKAMEVAVNPEQQYDAQVQLARIYGDKYADIYRPREAVMNYQEALTGYNDIVENEDAPNEFTIRKIDNIKVGLAKIYTDKDCEFCNYNAAMDLLMGSTQKSGYVYLQIGSIYANELYQGYNMAEAIRYYSLAAEHDNTTAMVRIGKCYLYGIGVDRNKEKAMLWFTKAAVRGDDYAKECVRNLKAAEVNMNPYSYMLLRQLMLSVGQIAQKQNHKLHEVEFKTNSKQAKKEEYLHRS